MSETFIQNIYKAFKHFFEPLLVLKDIQYIILLDAIQYHLQTFFLKENIQSWFIALHTSTWSPSIASPQHVTHEWE